MQEIPYNFLLQIKINEKILLSHNIVMLKIKKLEKKKLINFKYLFLSTQTRFLSISEYMKKHDVLNK